MGFDTYYFYKIQMENAIVSDVQQFITDSLPVIQYSAKGEENKPMIAVMDSNMQLTDTTNHTYEVVKDKRAYNPLLQFNRNGRRSIISSEIFRSLLRALYDRKYKGSADEDRDNEINLILQKITNTTVGKQITSDLNEYMATFFASFLYQNPITYDKVPSKITLDGILITPKYFVVYVPREIQAKLNDLPNTFEELKNSLSYNEATGYYSIQLKETRVKSGTYDLDVMCRHEYMRYNGERYQTIALECYDKGKCKYCGEQMVPFIEDTSVELPSGVYSVIFTFVESLKSKVNESVMINMFVKFIIQEVAKHEQLKSEEEVIAFAYLFIYRCYTLSLGTVEYVKKKANDFVSNAKNAISVLGMSKNEIDRAAEELFPDSKQLIGIFKDSIFNEVSFTDAFLYTVLFDDPSMKAVQEIYNSDHMKDFNTNTMIEYCKLWVYKVKRTVDKVNTAVELKRPSHKFDDSALLAFFRGTWRSYCPENGSHDYAGDTCKYCGINRNGKNIEEVFKKYVETVSSTYVFKNDNSNNFNVKRKITIDLTKYTDRDLFKVYLKDASPAIESHITKEMKEHPEKIHNLIISALHTDETQINNEVFKTLSYICDKGILSSTNVLSTLMSVYMPVHKIAHI